MKQVILVGGTTINEDIEKLKGGANIIIATPGRLEDMLSNCKSINLTKCLKSLVIKFNITCILFLLYFFFNLISFLGNISLG